MLSRAFSHVPASYSSGVIVPVSMALFSTTNIASSMLFFARKEANRPLERPVDEMLYNNCSGVGGFGGGDTHAMYEGVGGVYKKRRREGSME